MKILQVGKFYPIRGGVEKVMYDLVLGISDRGISCDMLCASTEDYPEGTKRLNTFAHLIVVPTKIKFAATMIAPAMLTTLRRIAKSYDIIHIHHPDPMAALALFTSGYQGKVVLHWHSDILKQKTLLKLYTPLQNWLINRADLIVGTTPVYVEQSPFLQKMQHKINYIPIGVEPIRSDGQKVSEIRKRYGDKKLLFSLGRLVEYKGYEYLIRAAQGLDDNFIIVIGGKGPLRQELETLAQQLGVQDKVEFIGFVSDEEVVNYFEACAVFCLTSTIKTEAFAIVQIEAMSCGKPVVSTDIPGSGVSWVNQHRVSGLIVPIRDERAVAQAIQEITAVDLYTKLSVGARDRYQKLFTRTHMVDKTLQLYDKILSK